MQIRKYDVIIVGLGPVGAALALLLGREGLEVAVFEQSEDIYDKPRAIVLDHEALRILQFCGVAPSFFDTLMPHTGTNFLGVNGQLIKLFDPQSPPYPLGWPPTVMFIQPELERTLRASLNEYPNIDVKLGATVSDLAQNESGVYATIESMHGATRYEVEADWLVGCDGANSFVRRSAGITLDDAEFDEWWVVVDAWLKGSAELPEKTTQYCWPSRPATFVKGARNHRRWEIKLLPHEDPEIFRDQKKLVEVLANYVEVDSLEIWRSAVYRFHAVVASTWQHNRIFVAGDAAHQMPPFLGQGLCAGLRDVANLAWKLVQVTRYGASMNLLTAYQTERRPHVETVIQHAKAFGLIIGELDLHRATTRDEELERALRNGTMNTVRQRFIPDLTTGLIAPGDPTAGTLFVQPDVLDAQHNVVRFDDLVPPRFLIVAGDETPHSWLEGDEAAAWFKAGGLFVSIGIAGRSNNQIACCGTLAFEEIGARFRDWLTSAGASVAIIRPDRYVYGTARNANELRCMLNSLLTACDGV
ncbi:bifunctional 3-(3-hydroxy-phenyl)propionate/3-hydroxycinnamic acid hydroxylase [Paraburkholderia sediminicola]|uniref:bifunctional 3-(3-hydroxy-phenyl)propionate/3-hydroxycinnamic acid hydroxylase n=1 Tax=Paraburkholderia sediminicola TaxID=458836 RepID=UPI0038B808FF